MSDRKFFLVDDGGADYWIVATGVEHAKELLRKHGVEFTKDDGDSAPIDDPAFAELEWKEMPLEAAAKVRCQCDDGVTRPLTECPLGDWFCSEW